VGKELLQAAGDKGGRRYQLSGEAMQPVVGVESSAAVRELSAPASEPGMRQEGNPAPGVRSCEQAGALPASGKSSGGNPGTALTSGPSLQGIAGPGASAVHDLAWCKERAEQGDAQAQYLLAYQYFVGEDVGQDMKQACEWLSKSAQQGHAGAQCGLGTMYLYGRHVEHDLMQAFDWFSKSAQQEHAEAQYGLGAMYLHGLHVEEDMKQAFEWFSKSARQGFVEAQCTLSEMYREGKGTERDPKLAMSWLMKSAGWETKSATSLNLSRSRIDGEMLAAMVSELRNAMAITSLDLSDTRVGDEEAKWLVELIEENASLRELNLQGHAFYETGLTAIAKALGCNTTLLNISVGLVPELNLGQVEEAMLSPGKEKQARRLIAKQAEANHRIHDVLRQQQSWQAQGWSGYPMDVLKMLEQSLVRADIKLRDSATQDTLARMREMQLCLSNVQPPQNGAES
jgi:hypothetical protein